MSQLSIVIPTHRRPSILQMCLQHIAKQTVVHEVEVIVVSDGHDAETEVIVKKNQWPMPVLYFEIEKSQQGTARNRGVLAASAPLCLFIGDDFLLESNCCATHLMRHKKLLAQGANQTAVLGFATWDPAVGITPVMRWLEQSGWQFGYPQITAYQHTLVPKTKQHLFTYASHLSIATNIAKELPFREDIRAYGWEDVEWGMRLRGAGIDLYYEPDAKAWHHHHLSLEDSIRRMETIGESAVTMQKIIPQFDRVPKGWKLRLYQLSSLVPSMAGRHRRAFLRGLKR